ncbi:MAG TPA: CoA pyrophosphatase [Actinomycetota bacterium]|nr:CoA pyrophosphatase [Actinomycetota bacterium]
MPDPRDELRALLDPDPRPTPAPGDRLAAVLALLIRGPEPAVLLTERAKELRRHPGEVSLPGGLSEPGDADLAATALRETEEEVGLPMDAVEVLGALPPVHTFVSGILVTPFVGTVSSLPTLGISDGEIVRVLTPTLATLDAIEEERLYERDGEEVWRGWAYEVEGTTIWGATGWMLHSLLELLRKETSWLTQR